MTRTDRAIICALMVSKRALSIQEIAKSSNRPLEATRGRLNRLLRKGLIIELEIDPRVRYFRPSRLGREAITAQGELFR